MRKFHKRVSCILCTILVAALLCGNAYAASGKLDIYYDFDGVTFDLYHVAVRQQDGTLTATEAFADYQLNLNTSEFRDIARMLAGYVTRDAVTPTASCTTAQGVCSFRGLADGIYLVLGAQTSANGHLYSPIPVLVEVSKIDMSVNMKSDQTPEEPGPDPVSCTVEKVWCGNGTHPESVTVQLLKDGSVYEEVILNAGNNWRYTWSQLDGASSWQVVEADVPEGYVVSVVQNGLEFKIINTLDTPVPPPSSDDTRLTVHKVWDDHNSPNRPDSVTVHLLKNGTFYEAVELNSGNQWTYTWDQLDADQDWSVLEAVIPDGYTVSYETFGNLVYIINSKDTGTPVPSGPVDLTVKKVWVGDEDKLENRPDSVGVTLYNGSTAVETVWLGDWNNWKYTWSELDGSGTWSVLEIQIPDGYTPSYSTNGNVVTITNTATLIRTGQLNWPIPVLGTLGLLFLAYGAYTVFRRRKNDHA